MVVETSQVVTQQAVSFLARLRSLPGRYGWLGIARRVSAKSAGALLAGWRRIAQHRNHVFRHNPSMPRLAAPTGMVVQCFTGPAEIPQRTRDEMARHFGEREVELQRWEMERKAVLWVATVNDRLAGVSMSRLGRYYARWFVPLRARDVVIYRNSTLPAFRGQGVCPAIMHEIVSRQVVADSRAYVDCKIYNKSSIRSIEKAGFQRVATLKPLRARGQLRRSRAADEKSPQIGEFSQFSAIKRTTRNVAPFVPMQSDHSLTRIERAVGLHRVICRRRAMLSAIGIAIVTCIWLVLTASANKEHRLLFFGLWRTRYCIVALAGGWLCLAYICRTWSRAALFAWCACAGAAVSAVLLAELIGVTGLVSYPAMFGIQREGLGAKAIPYLDVTGTAEQDLASRWGFPTDPVRFHYKTDRRGYRNEFDRAAAGIYLLGDSILVAGLLPFEETIAGLLESDLNCTAMNIALSGIGPQEERDLLMKADLPVRKRLVLQFVFEGNDLLDSSAYRQRNKSDPRARGKSIVQKTLAFNLLIWLQRASNPSPLPWQRRIGHIDGTDYLFAWLVGSFEGYEREFGHIRAALTDVRNYVTAAGGTYAVVFIPAKIRVLGPLCSWPRDSTLSGYEKHLNPLREALLNWCRSESIAVLDITEALSASARAGNVPWFAGDTHPNASGHRVAADAIRDWGLVQQWRNGPRPGG